MLLLDPSQCTIAFHNQPGQKKNGQESSTIRFENASAIITSSSVRQKLFPVSPSSCFFSSTRSNEAAPPGNITRTSTDPFAFAHTNSIFTYTPPSAKASSRISSRLRFGLAENFSKRTHLASVRFFASLSRFTSGFRSLRVARLSVDRRHTTRQEARSARSLAGLANRILQRALFSRPNRSFVCFVCG